MIQRDMSLWMIGSDDTYVSREGQAGQGGDLNGHSSIQGMAHAGDGFSRPHLDARSLYAHANENLR